MVRINGCSNDGTYLKGLIKDIKFYGFGYIKNNEIVKAIRSAEKDIEISYSEDECVYIARYKKPSMKVRDRDSEVSKL